MLQPAVYRKLENMMVFPGTENDDSGKKIFSEDIDISISYVASGWRFC